MIVVRYADDFVVGFQRQWEAESFLKDLKERLAKFGLDLHPDKTRLIEFGRFAKADRKRRGQGKPETFDFMSMTHYCVTVNVLSKVTNFCRPIMPPPLRDRRIVGEEPQPDQPAGRTITILSMQIIPGCHSIAAR